MALWTESDVLRLLMSIKRHQNFDAKSKGTVCWPEVERDMFPYDPKRMKNKFYHLTQHFRILLKKKRATEAKGLEYVPTNAWFQHMLDIYGDTLKSPQKQRSEGTTATNNVSLPCSPVQSLEDDSSYTGGSRLIVEDIEGDMLKRMLMSKASTRKKDSYCTSSRSTNVPEMYPDEDFNGNNSKEEGVEEDVDNSLVKACDAFGKSVALQLKQLPFIKSMELQMKIQSLITEELIKIRKGNVHRTC